MTRKKEVLILIVLIVIGMALRLWLIKTPINSDPMSYMNMGAGGHLLHPIPSGLHHHSLRPTMAWLVMVPALFFGYSVTTYYIASYAAALLSGLGLYVLGRTLFNARAALVLVAMWACSYAYMEVDTILMPDNIGASLIFLATAALYYAGGGFRDEAQPSPSPPWNSRRQGMAIVAGLLIWAGVGARETFVFHALVAMGMILFLRHRWRVFVWMTAAGLFGVMVELVYFYQLFGDPLIRFKYFLGIDDVLKHSFPYLSGGDLSWFALRYPKLLHYTGSAEFALFASGVAGALFWLMRLRQYRYLTSALFLAFPFGMIAFLYLSANPFNPFIEALVRYYAGCAGFFYLAGIDATLRIADGAARFGVMARRLTLAVAMAALVGVSLWNLSAAKSVPYLMISGYDAYARVSQAAKEDALRTGRDKLIYQSGGWGRIRPMYLSHEDGWETGPVGLNFDKPGYFIAEWRRLNQDGNIHEFMPLLECYPVLYRHRQGLDLTDLFFVGPQTIRRRSVVVDLGEHPQWSLSKGEDLKVAGLARMGDEVPLTIPIGAAAWTGAGDGDQPPPGPPTSLPGDRLLKLTFKATTAVYLAVIEAQLLGWTQTNPHKALSIYLGRIYHERSANQERQETLMAYLPESLSRFRIVLRTRRSAFDVRDVRLEILTPHPLDGFRSVSTRTP